MNSFGVEVFMINWVHGRLSDWPSETSPSKWNSSLQMRWARLVKMIARLALCTWNPSVIVSGFTILYASTLCWAYCFFMHCKIMSCMNAFLNTFATTHYTGVIMTTMASQITSLTVVYSTIYSGPDQRKHQSSASLAFVWGIHRDRWIPRTKNQLRGKCFHLMTSSWVNLQHTEADTPWPSFCRWLFQTHFLIWE